MPPTSEALISPADDHDLVLRLAAAAYLGRYTGTSRSHSTSDLRLFFAWCADQQLTALTVQRAQIERYVRWMQEIRRFKPSTVSRRMAVVSGFYRTCVIDGVLEHSPADYVRRPRVPAESPTLGLSHLQFGALLTAARQSPSVLKSCCRARSAGRSREHLPLGAAVHSAADRRRTSPPARHR
jgi:site-specific recombinase XerD